MFKWVVWAQIGRRKRPFVEIFGPRKEYGEGQAEEVEELLD